MSEESGEKEFAPTERRLDEARRKGEVPVGRDLLAAGSYAGFILACFLFSSAFVDLGALGANLLDQAVGFGPQMASDNPALMAGLKIKVIGLIAPFFLLPALGVIIVLVAQKGIVFAPERLQPKLNRISPIAGFKRKFGIDGLFEFVKSLTKLVCVALALGYFVTKHLDVTLASLMLSPNQILGRLAEITVEFLFVVLVLQLIIGGIDLLWQKAQHQRKQRMSRKEMMDEMKNSDGDPQMKARRRQKAEEVANNRMLADVAQADVVIVNPQHYAVALKWKRNAAGAPICVAKGVDEMAAMIRQRAQEAGVPLRRDPPTARALYASVEIGQEVRADHYRAVAAAIRFAEAVKRRGSRWSNGGDGG